MFGMRRDARLLLSQDYVRDLAVNEEVEIALGSSSDVQVRSVSERTTIDPSRANSIPLLPGVVSLRQTQVNAVRRIEVSNARDAAVDFELVVELDDGVRIIRADRTLGNEEWSPRIPAADSRSLHRYGPLSVAALPDPCRSAAAMSARKGIFFCGASCILRASRVL